MVQFWSIGDLGFTEYSSIFFLISWPVLSCNDLNFVLQSARVIFEELWLIFRLPHFYQTTSTVRWLTASEVFALFFCLNPLLYLNLQTWCMLTLVDWRTKLRLLQLKTGQEMRKNIDEYSVKLRSPIDQNCTISPFDWPHFVQNGLLLPMV